MIHEFFAVTVSGSLYCVRDNCRTSHPSIRKIAENKKGEIAIGTELDCGTMIAVCKQIQSFIPEGHSMLSPMTTFERNIENVNTRWWRGHTSDIIALFRKRRHALKCLNSYEPDYCDQRWTTETAKVLRVIGENHPTFVVCRSGRLALPLALLPASYRDQSDLSVP